MALSRLQIALLHVAPGELGVDEPTRRLVQRNVGGSESAATMGLAGFYRVMAWWEERGWTDRRHGRGYWNRLACDDAAPMRAKAVALAAELGWLGEPSGSSFAQLDGFVQRQTSGRRVRLYDCDRAEVYQVVEGLKAMVARLPVHV
jgi:hypothetical protein